MGNVVSVLRERGFIEQATDADAINRLCDGAISCYIGFDPTAASFHAGSLIPIMALAHMQHHGHRPVALVGGGTALVGDPSGKTEMRQMLTHDQVKENAEALKAQLGRFLDFRDDRAKLVNNADWLLPLQYIPFLRDIGRHFSVNRMLAAESCRQRMETGLSFIEFNYSVLQAYDFLHLFRTEKCVLQMGGSDQWGNIVAGIDLVRRVAHGAVFGLTFPLITTSSGEKMGKTARGAVWLAEDRTSPYEYYQFWINTADADVKRFLSLFTFLPLDEIEATAEREGAALNDAKVILAFEATKLVHGASAAEEALMASYGVFGGRVIDDAVLPSSTIPRKVAAQGSDSIPRTAVSADRLRAGIPAFELFEAVALSRSRSDARRLIEQGGAYVNGRRVESVDALITDNDVNNNEILLRAGKKRYHRISLQKNAKSLEKKG